MNNELIRHAEKLPRLRSPETRSWCEVLTHLHALVWGNFPLFSMKIQAEALNSILKSAPPSPMPPNDEKEQIMTQRYGRGGMFGHQYDEGFVDGYREGRS